MLLAESLDDAMAKRGRKPSENPRVTVTLRLDQELLRILESRRERTAAGLPEDMRVKITLSDIIRRLLWDSVKGDVARTEPDAPPVEPVKPKTPRRPKT